MRNYVVSVFCDLFVPRSSPLNTFCLSCRYVDIIHGSGNHAIGADAVLRSSVMATGSLCGRLVAVNKDCLRGNAWEVDRNHEDFPLRQWRQAIALCASVIAGLFACPLLQPLRSLPLFSQETTKKRSLTAPRCRGPCPTAPSVDGSTVHHRQKRPSKGYSLLHA
jgi:hypothetical protein